MKDSENKRPIDIIREMNPGLFIPTGQELANLLKEKEVTDWKICQRCCAKVPAGHKFCSDTCEKLFKQSK